MDYCYAAAAALDFYELAFSFEYFFDEEAAVEEPFCDELAALALLSRSWFVCFFL